LQSSSQIPKSDVHNLALFHPDPNHISNRLYRQLHTRVSQNGTEYGLEDLDPLLWMQTRYLLTGPSHEEAVRLLDEFLSTRAEKQIPDSVKRAILQRDLWAVFDWAAPSPNNEDHPARKELTNRLGPILRRLALTRAEINGLPDPYARAIQQKEYPAEYDPARLERAFLPPDFFAPNGPWVCIGVPKNKLIAPTHEFFFSRSAFFVFMRLPGGRAPTLAYLKKLSDMKTPLFVPEKGGEHEFLDWNPAVPQFPAGTELVLLRKLLLLDRKGNLVPTPVTESVQIRHYRKILLDYSNPDEVPSSQAVEEFELDHAEFFSGEHSGLRALTRDDRHFFVLMVQEDVFEEPGFSKYLGREWPLHTLSTCTAECHARPGAQSMMSLSFRESHANPHLAESTPAREAEKVITWKQIQDNWKLLMQLWGDRAAQ
jgi:hypothetical protein